MSVGRLDFSFQDYYSENTLKCAKNMGVKIFPVLIGSTYGQAKLQIIAEETGGVFYYAATVEEIRNAIFGVQEDFCLLSSCLSDSAVVE